MSPDLSFDRTRILTFEPGSYQEVHARQRVLLEERIARRTPDLVLLGEHERVITVGRGGEAPEQLEGIPVVEVERGGQATWHGPGQLVGYPIVGLSDLGLGVRDYLRALEAALIDALAAMHLSGRLQAGATGVWVDAQKVASIGVAVRRSVTWHGFALNVDPDLRDFELIRPCGFDPSVMTSLARLLGRPPDPQEVRVEVVRCLVRRLGLAPPIWE